VQPRGSRGGTSGDERGRQPGAASAAVTLGHQPTYLLLAGLASEIVPRARGCPMSLNSFSLFVGLGCGSAAVGALLPYGFGAAYGGVAAVAALSGLLGLALLRGQRCRPLRIVNQGSWVKVWGGGSRGGGPQRRGPWRTT